MSTPESKPGGDLHSDDAEARKMAASLMGSARTPAKIAAVRANAEKARAALVGKPRSEEHRRKLSEAALARAALKAATAEPKPAPGKRGRPAKPQPENPEPKRPRGRPKKAEATAGEE